MTTKYLCFPFKWATISYIPYSLEFPVWNNFILKNLVTLCQVKSEGYISRKNDWPLQKARALAVCICAVFFERPIIPMSNIVYSFLIMFVPVSEQRTILPQRYAEVMEEAANIEYERKFSWVVNEIKRKLSVNRTYVVGT